MVPSSFTVGSTGSGGGNDLGHAGGHHECDDARLTDRGTGIGALAQYRARGLFAGLLDRADGQVQSLDLIAGFLDGLAGQARDLALLADLGAADVQDDRGVTLDGLPGGGWV